jgi:hypothetical protein
MTDARPLHERVQALAQRYDAMAAGARRRGASAQDARNAAETAALLRQAADALVGARPAASFRRSWPYAVVMPGGAATTEGCNVRRPDGRVVFSQGVPAAVAQQACDALNEAWDEADGEA